MLEKIKETANYLKETTNFQPEVGIILGTGLGNLGNEIIAEYAIPTKIYQTFRYLQSKGTVGN